MTKFKVGDKVVGKMLPNDKGVLYLHTYLTQNKVYNIERVEAGLVVLTADDGVSSYWSEDWFKLYDENGEEMTAERIREDILHIEKRIEEAKKDIASMEQEKNALIEKLKEKGFEMIGQKPPSTTLKVGDRVVITGCSEWYHERDFTGYEGTLKRVDNSDRPYEVYLDRTRLTHWFTKNECKKI